MTKCRILFTINNLNTAGMKYVLADIVMGLNRTRFAPVIAVNKKTHSPLECRLASICSIIEMPLRIPRRPVRSLLATLIRYRIVLKKKFDLVHCFDYASDWTEGLLIRIAGLPWITVKTNLSWDPRKWWPKCWLSSRIICLSKAQMQVMRVWKRKLILIPTGIDIERFKKAEPLNRGSFGFQQEDVVLACIADLVPVKGHENLLQAFELVSRELPHLKLLFVGRGELDFVEHLKKLTKTLKINARVNFVGFTEKIPELLKMCDGKILPTKNEGRKESFGAAIVEAMAAGLPVIATRSGGPEDIVEDGDTGWLVESGSSSSMAQALKEFYLNPDRRSTFGINGQNRAEEFYHKKLMIRRCENLYFSILPKGENQLDCPL